MLSRAGRRPKILYSWSHNLILMSSQSSQSGAKRKYVPTVAKYRKRGMQWKPVRPTPARLFRAVSTGKVIYRFQRTSSWQPAYNAYSGFTTPSGSTIYGNALACTFRLSGVELTGNVNSTSTTIPNVTEFSSLFDEYRIDAVHIKAFYTNNVANTSAAPGTFQQIALPTGQFCIDYDDANAPASNTELLQRPETKTRQWNTNGPLMFTIKNPRAAYTVNTSTGVNSVAKGGGWMDMASINTNFYGFKIWLESFGSNVGTLEQGYFQFYFTYDLSMRGVR